MTESETDVLGAFEANNRWIIENFEELKKQYNNQWVAVLNKALVDQDQDLRKLVKRLKAELSNVYNEIAIEYVTSEEIGMVPSNFLWP